MAAQPDRSLGSNTALERMREREDVLEICYWYQGEGFGDRFSPASVLPFLKSDRAAVSSAFEDLVEAGHLRRDGGEFIFTPDGRKVAGKMFFDTFTDFQQGTHGECHAGCCDEEGGACESHDHGGYHGATAR